MAYRISRNIEASFIDFLKEITSLAQVGWKNLVVEKTFKRIYGLQIEENKQIAAICVRALTNIHHKAEVGTNATWREVTVMLDIFATSDGQREDLKDFLIEYIKHGIPYYQYVVQGETVPIKSLAGRLRILKIEDNPVNFNVDKNQLQVADRYRHILAVTVSTGKIEE